MIIPRRRLGTEPHILSRSRPFNDMKVSTFCTSISITMTEPTSSSSVGGATIWLNRQFKDIQASKDLPGISVGLKDDNIMEWEVMLMINDDCPYYGGMYLMKTRI